MNIQYGTIQEFRYETLGSGKKLVVKVLTDDRLTNWLPVKTKASSFLVEHTPVRIGDQVIVFNPFGKNEDGFVDRNITYKDIPLPADVDEDKFYKEFEDGTTYIFDTKTKKIILNTPCSVTITTAKDITVKTDKNVNVECTDATVRATSVTVDSSSIDLGIGGTGVITKESICPFTGLPHMDESKNTRSVK